MIRNEDELQAIFPQCRYPNDWVRPLNQAMEKFFINTIERAAAFLGQIGHESAELNTAQENLNYSPRRLMAVWPNRFPTLEDAQPYARNPERLANLVYGDRLGNGSPYTGEGYLYRGRGLIQITGKANYERIAEVLDLPGILEFPDNLLEPKYAALSAAAFWFDQKLNPLADYLIDEERVTEIVEQITRRINGGMHGFDNRLEYTRRAFETLTPQVESTCEAPEDWLNEGGGT